MRICDVCASAPLAVICHLPDFHILKCTECGLLLKDPAFDRKDVETLYNDAAYWEHPYFSDSHDTSCRQALAGPYEIGLAALNRCLPERGVLLDVGCGTGVFLQIASDDGWHATGLDVSRFAHEAAVKRSQRRVHLGSIEDVALDEGTFDAITLFDVIEHVTDPKAVIQKVASSGPTTRLRHVSS